MRFLITILLLTMTGAATAQNVVASPLSKNETTELRRAYQALADAQQEVDRVRELIANAHPTVVSRPCGFTFSADFTVIVEAACPPAGSHWSGTYPLGTPASLLQPIPLTIHNIPQSEWPGAAKK